MVSPYPYSTQEKNTIAETYSAKQSAYHSIYCLLYLSQSDIWVDTYAKKNGNIITNDQSRTSTYVYNYNASSNASWTSGPTAYSYIYLEEEDTFSLHCDKPQALDYVTLSVKIKNDSGIENNGNDHEKYFLQETGEKLKFLRNNSEGDILKGATYEVIETGEYDIHLQVEGSFNNTWLPTYLLKNDEILTELHFYKKDFRISTLPHVYLVNKYHK